MQTNNGKHLKISNKKSMNQFHHLFFTFYKIKYQLNGDNK